MLDINLKNIREVENSLLCVKKLCLKSEISDRCYQSLKAQLSNTLNGLYNERQDLKNKYHKSMDTYYMWKQEQAKINHQERESKFKELISSMDEADRQLLREFWHKV